MKYHTPKWKECETCERRNNVIACTFKPCEVREKKQKELFAKWHEQWAKNKLCFACKHCKHKEIYIHSNRSTEPYCELSPELYINGETTCDKWEEGGADNEM